MSLEQDLRMSRILVAFEVMSHVPAPAYNSSGGGSGEPDDRTVTLVIRRDDPPHLTYRRRYVNAHTDRSREIIITEAQAELDGYRKRTSKIEGKPLTEIYIEDGEGMSLEEARIRFGIAEEHGRRLRRRADRDPETGRRLDGVQSALSREESRMKAIGLRESGWSTRDVAASLGVHQNQVMRWIRSAKDDA